MYKTFFVALLATGFFTCSLSAQTTNPQIQPGIQDRQGQPQTQQPLNEFIAAKLVLCNNAEIKLARLAMENAESDDVKQFAQSLARDHAQVNQKLQRFVRSYPVQAMTDATGQAGAERTQRDDQRGQLGQDRPGDRPGQPGQGIAGQDRTVTSAPGADQNLQQLFRIVNQANDNHMEMARKKMSEIDGKEFDKAFVGSQMVMHMITLAELDAIHTNVDGELQSVVREMRESVKSHLGKAEELAKKHMDKKSDRDN